MTHAAQQPDQAPGQKAPENQIPAVQKKGVVETVLEMVANYQTQGGLKLPNNYSAENSVRAAWLLLQDITAKSGNDYLPALQVCTTQSIANALLKMVLQGLNPNKRQCSFIAYGNKLTLQREYAGSIAIAKRNGMKNITANVVYEGDDFEFILDTETGLKKIVKHTQTLATMSSGKIVGAYAFVDMEDGRKSVEVMTMAQVQAAWNQGPTKGQSPAHKNFPDQMAMKTVINRAIKILINSSDDSDLFSDEEEITIVDTKAEVVRQEITSNANKIEIGFDEIPDQETPSPVAEETANEVNKTESEVNNQPKQNGPNF
jgi:recombination protein RecT